MSSFLSEIVEQSSQQGGWPLTGGGWLVLALVNAGLAEQKNRSRLAWFLSSLLLGPFATFLIVIWEPVTDSPPEPLHVFSGLEDRYLTLAILAAVLTLGTLFFAVVVGIWYLWVAGSILAALLGGVHRAFSARSRTAEVGASARRRRVGGASARCSTGIRMIA